jgi:hypothetical protein
MARVEPRQDSPYYLELYFRVCFEPLCDEGKTSSLPERLMVRAKTLNMSLEQVGALRKRLSLFSMSAFVVGWGGPGAMSRVIRTTWIAGVSAVVAGLLDRSGTRHARVRSCGLGRGRRVYGKSRSQAGGAKWFVLLLRGLTRILREGASAVS